MSKNKSFKILFVYPNLMLQTTFPTGIALLSAKLKENGYCTCLFDTTFYQTEKVSSDEYRMEHLQVARFKMGDRFNNLPPKSKMLEDLQEMTLPKANLMGYHNHHQQGNIQFYQYHKPTSNLEHMHRPHVISLILFYRHNTIPLHHQ